MISKPLLQLIKTVLSKIVKWIDDVETRSPRAKKSPWYSREMRFHSVVVALISSVILFLVFITSLEPTFENLISVGVFVLLVMSLFSFYLRRDLPDLAQNEEAMSLLSVVFLSSLVIGKTVSVFSAHIWWVSIFSAPILAAPLLTALLLHPRFGMVVAFMIATIFGMVSNFSMEVSW